MDPFLIIVVVALGLFVFMQFRTAKKRRTEATELQAKMVPGTEIMTNYGLFATIISIDDETNEALIETTPGTVLRIHRQTILKAVEDATAPSEDAPEQADDADIDVIEPTSAPSASNSVQEQPTFIEPSNAVEPEFGERVVAPKKPARKSEKKVDE
ncbi:MAG: yajC [Homoserinimonas sp.]|jgi:preprotein translocase subunit YajC|nr:yajC [Homoserinimonas sp.]